MYWSRYFTKILMPVAAGSFLVSGCGLQWVISPKENPVLEDSVRGGEGDAARAVATLATTPERRLTLVNVAKDDPHFANFCSEAPADAAESISSTFQAAVEAKIEGGQGGTAEVARTLANAIQALTERSQGLQLYRDATYRLCEAYLNDVIDEATYSQQLAALSKQTAELIKFELEANGGVIGRRPYPVLSAPAQQKLDSLFEKAIDQAVDEIEKAEEEAEAKPADGKKAGVKPVPKG